MMSRIVKNRKSICRTEVSLYQTKPDPLNVVDQSALKQVLKQSKHLNHGIELRQDLMSIMRRPNSHITRYWNCSL